jgi:hypothetical protein
METGSAGGRKTRNSIQLLLLEGTASVGMKKHSWEHSQEVHIPLAFRVPFDAPYCHLPLTCRIHGGADSASQFVGERKYG